MCFVRMSVNFLKIFQKSYSVLVPKIICDGLLRIWLGYFSMLLGVKNNKWNNLQSLAIFQSVVIYFLNFWKVHQKCLGSLIKWLLITSIFPYLQSILISPLFSVRKWKYIKINMPFWQILLLITFFSIFVNLGTGDLYLTCEKCLQCIINWQNQSVLSKQSVKLDF